MTAYSTSDRSDSGLMQESLPLQNYCIAMQPICDGDLKHVGDELLYRDSATATFANVADDQAVVATARVYHIAFYEIGIERLVGKRRMFVNAPRDMLLKPELLPSNPDQLVIEVLEDVAGDPEVVESLRRIRSRGFDVALDDFVLTPETEPLLEVATIVKVDMLQPFDEPAVARYKRMGLRLMAEKVEDFDSFERLRAMGFELFQGYFYARPETQKTLSNTRNNNHAALMRLVSALYRCNTDFKEIERIIAQDAALTFLLLKYANSARFHYRGKIETIFQVLLALGLKPVRNMAITMLIANNGPASKLLLSRALTRADMCERLAKPSMLGAESAFLAGLLSMMGPLLGKPLPELMKDLSLSADLIDAVLTRGGPLGVLLKDVEAFENANTAGWTPERVETFNRTWMKSQVWTTEILSMVDAV
ncbi:EAL and HDOD domain-containing protein [Parapusillimonas granuli]|uniref:HDOD domain-containing protein n=1 Tax=Parapusillimonas granuli TaxID=380911 RepID=A0A853FZK0_9BURK|nr:HDOD domain-containing protein [Parapusillimonas granuli]MBB5213937.1 EAL and modified HD-GYP domain-containing signal transduction protein [Parapusillimonas granuli]NYT50358.1 HDOD domain-containing protein [Parapusillimonas granuli]